MTYAVISSRIIDHWKSEDVPYLPGVTDLDLVGFALKYSVALPADLRELYLKSDGTFAPGAAGCDHNGFAFWPLTNIRPDTQFSWAYIFADFMDESWWFAIDLLGGGGHAPGAVYLLGDISGEPLLVAQSFSEFGTLYLGNADRLNPLGARRFNDEFDRPGT